MILSNGAASGQPLKAVAHARMHVLVAGGTQGRGGLLGKRGLDFDGVDVFDEPAEHRRLIAAAGADLQHAIRRLGVELSGHPGHDVRRRDRLAVRRSAVWCRCRHTAAARRARIHAAEPRAWPPGSRVL